VLFFALGGRKRDSIAGKSCNASGGTARRFLAPTYVALIDAGNETPEAKRLPGFFRANF